MPRVEPCLLPKASFLHSYADQSGCYTDCFTAQVPKAVVLPDLINTFFTTPTFRLERALIAFVGRKPSNAQDVDALAMGRSDQMSAWQVETRDEDQLLLKVGEGPIRTWLMRESVAGGTNLYFGSAIEPLSYDKQGNPQMDFGFRALLGFHKLYARILLSAAARRLA